MDVKRKELREKGLVRIWKQRGDKNGRSKRDRVNADVPPHPGCFGKEAASY